MLSRLHLERPQKDEEIVNSANDEIMLNESVTVVPVNYSPQNDSDFEILNYMNGEVMLSDDAIVEVMTPEFPFDKNQDILEDLDIVEDVNEKLDYNVSPNTADTEKSNPRRQP
ncbi:hypothetical protein J6590_024475 [Homalodisca vitripennis]|nr:hypothetical protein J6590_024475 [Homalodisca vitripennis]